MQHVRGDVLSLMPWVLCSCRGVSCLAMLGVCHTCKERGRGRRAENVGQETYAYAVLLLLLLSHKAITAPATLHPIQPSSSTLSHGPLHNIGAQLSCQQP